MKLADILCHSSMILDLRDGWKVLLVSASNTPHVAKSKGFTSGEEEGQKLAAPKLVKLSWQLLRLLGSVCQGTILGEAVVAP